MISSATSSSTRRGIWIALLSAVIFGAHTPAERAVYADGGSVAPVLVVTIWARAFAMGLYCLLKRKALYQSRQDFKQAFIGGSFQIFSTLTLLLSLLYVPAPVAIVIAFSHTLMLLFFLAWRKEVRLDKITVATTVMALIGLSCVIDLWHPQPGGSWIGIALAFLSAVANASRMYVYGHQTQARNPAIVGAETFLLAAPMASLILFVAPLHLPSSSTGFAWLGVASCSFAFGTFFFFYGISLLGSFRYSLFSKVEPIFTSLFSVWFLGEVLKLQQYMGIFIVIASLVLYQISEQWRMKRL